MKRMSRIICTLALLLMSLSAALPANAALKTRSATIDPATGYPTWYQDTNNLALTNCLDQNGFCLAAFTGAALPTAKANISAANFPEESFFFMADTSGVSPLGVISLTLWEAALEAGFAATVVDGGQAVFTRIRIRADVTVPGTYVVTHPYGEETFVVDAIVPGPEINFTNDIPGLVPQDFDSAVTPPPAFTAPFVGPTFLTRADGTFITDPVTGNRYIGQPAAPVAVTGSPTGNNFVRIVGGGDTFLSTTFGLQGKVIGMDVTPATSLNLGGTNIITPAAVPQTVTVTNTTGAAITFPADLNAAGVKGGADATDFTVVAPAAVGAVNCAGATVAALNPAVAGSGTCSFDITFTPAAIAKAVRTATVLLAPTAVAPALAPPPVTLNLSGTGLVNVTTTAVGHGTITPATLAAPAASTVELTVTPSNKKFKIKDVSDATTAATALVTGPPFTINAGAANHAVTATFMPSGDLDQSGALDVADAMKALKIVAGVQAADSDDPDNTAVKVAPLAGGVPAPDATRVLPNIADVLVILRRVIGLETW
ncbi:MAG: hypothetical protein HYV06_03300 [Deltaproteobacteria bacterium]|nr:hypothetical protein [Deltaproteobacteria bacterium]